MMNSTSLAFSIRKAQWQNPNTFPGLMYEDANPIMDVKYNRTYGNLIEEYWGELVSKGGMITWSNHTINEVSDVIHINKCIEFAAQNGIKDQKMPDGKIVPAYKVAESNMSMSDSIMVAEFVQTEVNDIFEDLLQYGLPINPLPEQDVQRLTNYLHRTYGGSRKDAQHAAIANLIGTNALQSNDSGFLRYPHLNVYGASSTVLKHVITPNQSPTNYVDLSAILKPIENNASKVTTS